MLECVLYTAPMTSQGVKPLSMPQTSCGFHNDLCSRNTNPLLQTANPNIQQQHLCRCVESCRPDQKELVKAASNSCSQGRRALPPTCWPAGML
jgi:hypothetical protein